VGLVVVATLALIQELEEEINESMDVILKVVTGPEAGREMPVLPGEALSVGRTSRSSFIIARDTFLSGVHFALECGESRCRVVDRGSANGTFLNGIRVTEAVLKDGDQIRAGQTMFVVHIAGPKEVEPPQPPPASPGPVLTDGGASADAAGPAFQIGGWSLGSVPSGWELLEQLGLRRAGKDIFPSNAVVTEEPLPQDKTLQQYIDSQVFLMHQVIPEVKLAAGVRATIRGAAEAFALEIRFPSDDGRPVAQRQVYARAGRSVGILTFTTLEEELPMIRPVFDSILGGVTFHSRE
jgi:hypothetical protein